MLSRNRDGTFFWISREDIWRPVICIAVHTYDGEKEKCDEEEEKRMGFWTRMQSGKRSGRKTGGFFLAVAVVLAMTGNGAKAEEASSGESDRARVEAGYVAYLKDTLLPEYGYADLEEKNIVSTSELALTQGGWDMRSGVFGAEMADLDGDGKTELLVYDRGPDLEEGYIQSNGSYGGAMFLSVYRTEETGEIALVNRIKVSSADMSICYHTVRMGLMMVKKQVCVYVEEDTTPYFANGSYLGYTWYGFDEEANFRALWKVGKTDGGSSGIAYSLLRYTGAAEPEKDVLWADGEFRKDNPGVPVYTTEEATMEEALAMGIHLLGISGDTLIASGGSVDPMPSMWENIHQSAEYDCRGNRENGEVDLVSRGGDYTGVRNVVPCDKVGQGIREASGGTGESSSPSRNLDTLDGSLFADGQPRTGSSGYILSDSDSRYLQESDIAQLSLKGLCYAKNEIYARHHRKFLSAELSAYFNAQPWYTGTIEPQDFTEEVVNQTFNEYEKKNSAFLGSAEESRGTYVLDQ